MDGISLQGSKITISTRKVAGQSPRFETVPETSVACAHAVGQSILLLAICIRFRARSPVEQAMTVSGICVLSSRHGSLRLRQCWGSRRCGGRAGCSG
jgi:hypothetical protein